MLQENRSTLTFPMIKRIFSQTHTAFVMETHWMLLSNNSQKTSHPCKMSLDKNLSWWVATQLQSLSNQTASTMELWSTAFKSLLLPSLTKRCKMKLLCKTFPSHLNSKPLSLSLQQLQLLMSSVLSLSTTSSSHYPSLPWIADLPATYTPKYANARSSLVRATLPCLSMTSIWWTCTCTPLNTDLVYFFNFVL